MSGGSYEYLYAEDCPGLFNKMSRIEEMRDRLSELGFASESEYTDLILEYMNDLSKRCADILVKKGLDNVWKAIEWHDSCDWGIDQVKEAVEEFRAKNGIVGQASFQVGDDVRITGGHVRYRISGFNTKDFPELHASLRAGCTGCWCPVSKLRRWEK